MGQEIEFDYDEKAEEFVLLLDGEEQGPVDEDSLEDSVGDLYLHFYMFRDHREREEELDESISPSESLSDEEVEQAIEDVDLSSGEDFLDEE
jgi:hypothetical protein